MSVGLDWLSGTIAASDAGAVASLLEGYFGAGEAGHIKRYGEAIFFGEGKGRALVAVSRDESGLFARPEAFLDFPGTACGGLEADVLCELLGVLAGVGFKCTRLDAKYDDFEWVRTPEAIVREHVYRHWYGSLEASAGHESFENGGKTIEFGKRGRFGCGYMVSIYDKNKESGGEIDACRYEARFYKDHAEAAFARLVPSAGPFGEAPPPVSHVAAVLGGLVASSITFFEVDERGRQRVAPWWAVVRERLRRSKDFGSPRGG